MVKPFHKICPTMRWRAWVAEVQLAGRCGMRGPQSSPCKLGMDFKFLEESSSPGMRGCSSAARPEHNSSPQNVLIGRGVTHRNCSIHFELGSQALFPRQDMFKRKSAYAINLRSQRYADGLVPNICRSDTRRASQSLSAPSGSRPNNSVRRCRFCPIQFTSGACHLHRRRSPTMAFIHCFVISSRQ